MALEIMDWTSYINCHRGLLIAPAGHGKTTAIADCLLQCPEQSCHLVLTHTHAGIASLRKKFNDKNVPTHKYQLDTITGFAQRYVLSFLGTTGLPAIESKDYFPAIVEHCAKLMNSCVVQQIIQSSYAGVFVDEYQDCTIDQHEMVRALAQNLPLHILGDPLQGIFSFEKRPLVNFEKDFEEFEIFDLLKYPWRWEKSNPALGKLILEMRQRLAQNETINLRDINCKGLEVVYCNTQVNLHEKKFLKLLRGTIRKNICESMLIVYPSYSEFKYGKKQPRGMLKDRIDLKIAIDFGYGYQIINAIDAAAFYSCARQIDQFINDCLSKRRIEIIKHLYNIMHSMHFPKGEMNVWIDCDHNRIKNKRDEAFKSRVTQLQSTIATYEQTPNLGTLLPIFEFIYGQTCHKCHYKEFYYEIRKSISNAIDDNITVCEAMTQLKNRIRHIGRKIEGRCIGTTLLTKGLEFDTVIIYEADKFEDAKNFYVAISRACRNLILITSEMQIHF